MSRKTNTIDPLETENVIDPRMLCLEKYQAKLKWGVDKGFADTSFITQQADSYSSSGFTFSFNTQSTSAVIDRRVYARCQFLVTITGQVSQVGQRLINNGYDSLRSFPLTRITNTINCSINGSTVSVAASDAMKALFPYNTNFDLTQYDLSGTPTQLDLSQNYSSLLNTVKNPLNPYFDSPYQLGRGSFKFVSLNNPVSTQVNQNLTATAIVEVLEPIFCPPFLFSSQQLEEGLVGVQNLSIQYNFRAGFLSSIWSHANPSFLTNWAIAVSIGPNTTAPPQVELTYLSLNQMDAQQIPRNLQVQYYRVDNYTNNMNTNFAFGETKTITMNSIQLATVPKAIYVYATRPYDQQGPLIPDCFHGLEITSINYLNKNNILSGQTKYQQYQMCVKNGLKQSFLEFDGIAQDFNFFNYNSLNSNKYGLVGPVIKITSADLSLDDMSASGLNTTSSFLLKANVTNLNEKDVGGQVSGIQMTVIMVYDGLLNIYDNTASTEVGFLTKELILETRKGNDFSIQTPSKSLYGGSFWSGLKSLGSKILDSARLFKPAIKAVSKYIPGGEELYETAEDLGFGKKSKSKKKTSCGGAQAFGLDYGGKLMSRTQMKQMLG
jgi:hypothetical protein